MLWIDARSVAAEVIKRQSFRDWADDCFVDVAAAVYVAAIESESRIPFIR